MIITMLSQIIRVLKIQRKVERKALFAEYSRLHYKIKYYNNEDFKNMRLKGIENIAKHTTESNILKTIIGNIRQKITFYVVKFSSSFHYIKKY